VIDTPAVSLDLAARFVATIERRRLPLAAMVTATGASLLGRQLATVAIPAAVYTATGSAIQTGLTATCLFFPWLLTDPEGSALSSRIGPKHTNIVAGVLGAAALAAIPVFHLPAGLPLSSLLLLAVVFAWITAIGSVARHSMMPETAVLAGSPVNLAGRAMRATSHAAIVTGTLLALLLIAQFGEARTLTVAAVLIASATAADVLLAAPTMPDRSRGRAPRPRLSAPSTQPTLPTAGTLDPP
jgi:hypothetical protein